MLRITGILVAALLLWQCTGKPAVSQESDGKNTRILLMTSLPIIWGDGASMDSILSGEASPAPIYKYWKDRYDIEAVDSFEELARSDTDLIILAQPRAMDPADLAAIDKWVRSGGNALILTDPALVWHSDLPLGDSRRPLASGLLSPLLTHWNLELLAPDDTGEGMVELAFRDFRISTVGMGTFRKRNPDGDGKAECVLSSANIMAQCKVGQGRAILVADADFLHEATWTDDPAWQVEGKSNAMRLADALVSEFPDIASNSND